jgi:hypothetical protein
MPSSYQLESSPGREAIKSKGWELNSGFTCPAGSFNGATDHFSFDLHVPGGTHHPGGTSQYTTGDAQLIFDSTFGVWRVASTVTLKPGKYVGSFSLNRSGDSTFLFPPSTIVPDFCTVTVWMQPINGPADYEFQEPGDGAGRRPWACFQNVNGPQQDFLQVPPGVPTFGRSWINNGCPDGGVNIDCFEAANWPDGAGYELISGEWYRPSPFRRYRCPFRIWVTPFGAGDNDMDFHLDGHLVLT